MCLPLSFFITWNSVFRLNSLTRVYQFLLFC